MRADAESSCPASFTDSWSQEGARNPWSAPTTELWAPTEAAQNAAIPAERLKTPAILRTKDVLNVVGIARTTLWRRVKSGDFPQPVRLGGAGSRAVGWRSGDVEQWLAERQSV